MIKKINKSVNSKGDLNKLLPPIEELNLDNISSNATLIGSAGFEDRCFSFLDKLINSNKKIEDVVGVEYEPFNEKNRKEEFEKKAKIVSLKNNVQWVTYDRLNPNKFYEDFEKIEKLIRESNNNLIIDISGMSKYLIVILLDIFKDFNKNMIVIYSEAKIYYPTQEEYLKKRETTVDIVPTFLTKGVYKIVLTTPLSSIAMQNAPLLMIAFPSFNYKELAALLNEMTPQYLIKIEGIPHETHNRWRYDAVHEINEKIDKDFKIKEIKHEGLSTFDYIGTVSFLDEIYNQFKYTHKFIIAPTGSKFQSIGVFFFKQLHHDVQVVYPVARKFAEEYTEGCERIWMINFSDFNSYIKDLEKYSNKELISLEKLLDEE